MGVNMHGVKLTPAAETLAERRALLTKLEAETTYPGLDRFIREVKAGIRRLEARIRKEGTV